MRGAAVALCVSLAAAQSWTQPLRFRADGTFKVVEVSDTHFTRNLFCKDLSPAQERYPCSDSNATAFWRKLIAEEDPDVFLFTGDNVCSGNILGGADSIDGMLADWAAGGANAHVPWVAVEGNHDGESGLDYAQVAAKLLTMPNGLQVPNAQYLGAPVYGNTNFLVSVLGASGTPDAAQPKLNLYMIDSNSYSTLEPAVGGYGWPHLNQLSWLVNTSAAIKAAAAAGGYAAPPALAYQHIPLVQHKEWVASNGAIVGQFHEAVCSPDNDSGEFMQLLEVGDIKAVTVGHDHTNDYCTASPVSGKVTLCYDGHGSYGASGYGEPDWPIRARVWHVSHFGGLIQTYKHLDDLAGGALNGSTIIDLQTIYGTGLPLADMASSQTSGSPSCPPGFSVVDVDLNKDAGGSYSYVCLLRATGTTGPLLLNASVATAPRGETPACAPGWLARGGNLKEGTSADVAEALCVLIGVPAAGDHVVTDVVIAQGAGAVCPASYTATTGDLSGGVGLYELLCVRFDAASDALARVRGSPLERLPKHFELTAVRPADKRPRVAPPARRKPLEGGRREL